MNTEIKQLLEALRQGQLSTEEVYLRLKMKPFEDVGYARVDLHRKLR